MAGCSPFRRPAAFGPVAAFVALAAASSAPAAEGFARAPWVRDRVELVAEASVSVVKLYGAGGVAGIEGGQTGLVVSPTGDVLTADTLALETGGVRVVAEDGSRWEGRVVGADPLTRVALVRLEGAGDGWRPFDLSPTAAEPGEPVLALSNLFAIAVGDEAVSVQRATLGAVGPADRLLKPAGAPLGGTVLVLDAVTSNPGAAGGAVIDYRGQLLGMLGAECRGRATGAWISYAIPTASLAEALARIESGVPPDGAAESVVEGEDPARVWGFTTVAEVSRRTPPFIDWVAPGAPADAAGLRPDDLVVLVEGATTSTVAELRRELARVAGDAVTLTVDRRGELIDMQLRRAP